MRYGANLKPVRGGGETTAVAPLFHYPFEQWRTALVQSAHNSAVDARDGLLLEFTNPADGGPVMNTISAFCQYLPSGFMGKGQQSTDGLIFVGVEGNGIIHINDQPFFIGSRDVVVVPSWAKRRIDAASDLILFSYSDRATQQKLGLWKQAE